jgi:hypothetical protein
MTSGTILWLPGQWAIVRPFQQVENASQGRVVISHNRHKWNGLWKAWAKSTLS